MNKCEQYCRTIQRLCNTGAAPLLPTEYQQVEYLQSTGTQFINTGVEGWDNLVVQLDQEIVSYSGNEFDFFGSDDPWGTAYNYIGVFNSYSSIVFQTGGSWVLYGSKDNLRHVHTVDAVNKIVYTDNNTPVSGASLTWYTTAQCAGKPFRLFLRFPNKSVGSLKLYGATFTRSGELIREFIPCYRISDSEPGMYDIVTKTFFTNAGTGEFTVGNNV